MSDFAKLKSDRKSREIKCSFIKHDVHENAISTTPPTRDDDMPVDASQQLLDGQKKEDTAMNVEVSSEDASVPNLNGLYSSLQPFLEVRMSTEEGKGRSVWTKIPRKPGDVLLSLKPHISALSNQHLDSYCSACFGPGSGTSLKRCPSCKIMHYCDSKCQGADWSLHKFECPALKRWASSAPSQSTEEAASLSSSSPSQEACTTVPSDAIRCLGRILWRRKMKGAEAVWVREIDGMQSHRTLLNKLPDSRDSQLHTHLSHSLVQYLGLSSPADMAEYGLNSIKDLVDLISRFTTNTFTLSTPSLTPLGACVSPTIALINHSCDPNTAIVFPRVNGKEMEPQMQVVALKYIAPDEEILTAYVDTTLPRHLRQQALSETYHFVCRCSLCTSSSLQYRGAINPSSPINVDPREAMHCPKKCGGLCWVPTEEQSLTRCSKCKAPVHDTDAVLDALRVGREGLEKAERVQFSDVRKAKQLTTNLIPILSSAGLLPSTHPLLGLTRLHTALLIGDLPSPDTIGAEEILSPGVQSALDATGQLSQGSGGTTPVQAQALLDDAIRSSTLTNTGLAQVLVYGHPVRAIALAELGKLLQVDEPAPKQATASPAGSVSPPSASLSSPASTSTSSLPSNLPPPPQVTAYPPSGPARLKLAYETLVRARNELIIGFGSKNEGGEVGKEVRRLLVDLEKELGVWKAGVRNVLEDQNLQRKQ